MKYIIIITLILSAIEIFLLKRRIAQLEMHNPENYGNARQPRNSRNYGSYDSHVYVIPDMTKRF